MCSLPSFGIQVYSTQDTGPFGMLRRLYKKLMVLFLICMKVPKLNESKPPHTRFLICYLLYHNYMFLKRGTFGSVFQTFILYQIPPNVT